MGADSHIVAHPPAIGSKEILKLVVGNEPAPCRTVAPVNAAVLVKYGSGHTALDAAFAAATGSFMEKTALIIGGDKADIHSHVIPLQTAKTTLRLMEHMAMKLILNTISTGTMICLGRVTGNWMTWVDLSNKKLIDRGIRLLVEMCGLEYEEGCTKLFEAMEEIKNVPQGDRPSAVQYAIHKHRKNL